MPKVVLPIRRGPESKSSRGLSSRGESFARPVPRAGAWYPVVGEASGQRAVLEVRGRRVAILKRLLEIRPHRPEVFTVVVRSRETAATLLATRSLEIERVYAVCPACAQRVRVLENQAMATCAKCGHRAEIAWWKTG
jgi:DNA-directed RNA polymerase subunit RPC12/RpoP